MVFFLSVVSFESTELLYFPPTKPNTNNELAKAGAGYFFMFVPVPLW